MLGRPQQGLQAREVLQAKLGKSTRQRGHKEKEKKGKRNQVGAKN